MEIPFNLSDKKLKKLLDGYFVWCNKNEKEKKYPGLERRKTEERKKNLLDKEHIQGLPDEELAEKILEYSKNLEGPVDINIGKPRVLAIIGQTPIFL